MNIATGCHITILFGYSMALYTETPEEVRHGDVTTGVKRAWNVITVDKYSFFSFLEAFYFSFLFKTCTNAGSVDALKVQSSNSNTKVSRIQVHSLSEGPTRGLGVRLTCRLSAFIPQNIKAIACFNSPITDCRFYYGNLY